MGPMNMNYYASSPTVVLSPQAPLDRYSPSIHPSAIAKSSLPIIQNSYSDFSSWRATRSLQLAKPNMFYNPNMSRKRSRGAMDQADEEDLDPAKGKVVDGMLISDGISIEADDLNRGRTPAPVPFRESELEPLSASNKARRIESSHNKSNGPLVDDIARLLGVGWRRLPMDESTRGAARGWAKFVENHHRLTNPTIILQRSNGYLVEAKEGYFFFDDALREGTPVGNTWDECVARLQSSLMVFEGSQTTRASPQVPTTNNAAYQPTIETDDETDVLIPTESLDTDVSMITEL